MRARNGGCLVLTRRSADAGAVATGRTAQLAAQQSLTPPCLLPERLWSGNVASGVSRGCRLLSVDNVSAPGSASTVATSASWSVAITTGPTLSTGRRCVQSCPALPCPSGCDEASVPGASVVRRPCYPAGTTGGTGCGTPPAPTPGHEPGHGTGGAPCSAAASARRQRGPSVAATAARFLVRPIRPIRARGVHAGVTECGGGDRR